MKIIIMSIAKTIIEALELNVGYQEKFLEDWASELTLEQKEITENDIEASKEIIRKLENYNWEK